MIRRHALALMLVTATLVGCGGKQPDASGTRAGSRGEFADNPLLAVIPSDTPYAFATFKPIPLEYLSKVSDAIKPMWSKAFDQMGADQQKIWHAFTDEIGPLDAKRFEELGFSTKARVALYGIGAYPVMRIEITSGDRVFALVGRLAARFELPLPAPTQRGDRRYWIIDVKTMAVLIALDKTELVMSIGPRSFLDSNLALILGEQRPAKPITTSVFRDIATRDGYSDQGVGFVDLARVGQLAGAAAGLDAGCQGVVGEIAAKVPRLTLGYDDFTAHKIAMGFVVELAPDLAAEVRSLAAPLAGFDKLLELRPLFAVAVSGNVEHARGLATKLSTYLRDLDKRCPVPGMEDAAQSLGNIGSAPLPPFATGIHGGILVANDLKFPNGLSGRPEAIDGYAVVRMDHADDLLKMVASQLPGIEATADGKPHALPALLGFPGSFAAHPDALALAMGANSDARAVDLLGGTPVAAPLLFMEYDYTRLFDIVLADKHDAASEMSRAVVKLFGLATIQVLVDERGLVSWFSFELK